MKKALSILLTLILLLSLFGCAAAPTAPQESAPQPTQPAETDTPTKQPEDTPAESVTPTAPAGLTPPEPGAKATADNIPKGMAENTIPYPICESGAITLEYWRQSGDAFIVQEAATNGAYADNYAYAELEKITGVHVDFNLFTSDKYATQFSLMLASEDFPDIAEGANYAGGPDAAVEDGIFLDMAPYIQQYAPNFLRWLQRDESQWKSAFTDAGRLPFFQQIYDQKQPAWYGLGIRTDWLNDLGLAMPTTMDELHDVLVAFRDNKTNGGAPMDLMNTGFSANNHLEGAFNIFYNAQNVGMIQKDGVLESSYRSEGLRQYLEVMHQWYEEGLINRDFPSQCWLWDPQRMMNDEMGVCNIMYTQMGSYCADTEQAGEGCFWSCMPYPTADGIERKVYTRGKMGGMVGGACIFADSEYTLEAMRWMDYRYSEPGYTLSNYGIEGVTFNYDENGMPQCFELLTNNPEGYARGAAQEKYLIHNGPCIFMLYREESSVNEEGLKYRELWSTDGEWNFGGAISYTSEESEERSGLVADLDTYVQEFASKVIMGQIELNDDTWTEFQDQLTAMKLDRVVEIIQVAYDRYVSR